MSLFRRRSFVQDQYIKIHFYPPSKTNTKEKAVLLHQFAFAVPKKNFPNAVDRNRIKRQMREIIRLNKQHLAMKESNAFFITYINKQKPNWAVLEKSMVQLIKHISG